MLSVEEANKRLRLHPGEEPEVAYDPATSGVWPLYISTLGFYSFWRRKTAFALTNQRVILRRGIVSTIERSVPISMIQDATVASSLWLGYVIISTAGGAQSIERLGPLSISDARTFADSILQTAAAARPGQPSTTSSSSDRNTSTLAQLEHMGRLREQGVITEHEFQAKKAELLGRL